MEPGPTPTFTASTPASIRALAPSDVATLPAINSHLGKLDFVDLMALMTPAECQCDVSIDITSAYTVDIVDQPSNYLPLSGSMPAPDPVPIAEKNSCAEYIEPNINTSTRTDVYNILVQQFGYNPQTNDDLTNFAANPGIWINGNPLILSSYPSN